MGAAEDKLAELLGEKEQELYALKEEIEAYKDTERRRWARHTELPKEQTLPVPRLEIWLDANESDTYNRVWVYRMIYRHMLGHCIAVPLGVTKQSGGGNYINLLDYLPFRDGAHIRHDAEKFAWPAFIVRGEEAVLIPEVRK